MTLHSSIIQFAEAAGRKLIDAENTFCDIEAVDDDEHSPVWGGSSRRCVPPPPKQASASPPCRS